jgi:hypothetical protein
MSPRAFLEKYLVISPVLQVPSSDINTIDWTILRAKRISMSFSCILSWHV